MIIFTFLWKDYKFVQNATDIYIFTEKVNKYDSNVIFIFMQKQGKKKKILLIFTYQNI